MISCETPLSELVTLFPRNGFIGSSSLLSGLVQWSRAGDNDWRERLRIVTYVFVVLDDLADVLTC